MLAALLFGILFNCKTNTMKEIFNFECLIKIVMKSKKCYHHVTFYVSSNNRKRKDSTMISCFTQHFQPCEHQLVIKKKKKAAKIQIPLGWIKKLNADNVM